MKFKDIYIKIRGKDKISNIILNDIKKIDSKKETYKLINYYYFHLIVKNPNDTELLKRLLVSNFDMLNDAFNDLIIAIEPAHNLSSRVATSKRKVFGQTLRMQLDRYFGIKTHSEINKDYWNKHLYTVLYNTLFVIGKKDFNIYRLVKGFTFLSYIVNEGARN